MEPLIVAGRDDSETLGERLRRELSLRRAIEQSMLAGVSAVDLEGRQIYVNPAFSEMLGWSVAELVGATPPFVYWPAEEIGRIEEAFARTLRGKSPREGFELRFRRRNGELFDAQVLISPLREDETTTGWLASVYDVSSRKRSEETLRQDEERLRLALEAGRLGAWEWDIAGGTVTWSRELEEIHGLAPGAFPGTFEAFQSDIHPEDRERVLAAIQSTLRGEPGGYRVEYRIVRPDGAVRWIDAKARVVPDAAGEPHRMTGVCHDATERKRQERLLRLAADASAVLARSLDHQQTLRSLAELAVPDLADWCVIHTVADDGGLDIAEVAHTDPVKVELARRLHERWPALPDADVGAAAAVREGRSLLYPEITRELLVAAARDDEHLGVLEGLDLRSSIVVPLRVRGRVLGALTLVASTQGREYREDDLAVAEELAARAALALDSSRLFREAEAERSEAEAAAARLKILAEGSRSLAATPAYEDALRELASFCVSTVADYAVTYSLEEDGTIRRVGLAHADPERQPWVEELVATGAPRLDDPYGAGAVFRTGEPVLVSEIPAELLERAAQNERHLEVLRHLGPRSSILVALPTGAQNHAVLALATTDDSGRRYTQEDLVLIQELAARVGLLINNARLYGQAQRAAETREEMMAVLSHDLRTPLHTILLGCELLEHQGDAVSGHVDRIRRAAGQMSRLVRDLLDVNRIETGQLDMARDPVQLGPLAEEAVGLLEPLAEEKSLRLAIHPSAGEDFVQGDRERLLQVLSNLVGNAVKFTPAGGRVDVRIGSEDGERWLTVSDTGPGISDDHLPRVFDRFWRADPYSGEGTGLGLAITKAIVEAHQGRIEVESAAGQGSTFRLRLPGPS